VCGWLLLVGDGKWPARLLEGDVVTGMWRGEKQQRQYRFNIKLRRVRVTTLAVVKQ
jgi:hypothetical protein